MTAAARGWWLRFWTVLLPGIPVNFAIGAMMELGFSYLISAVSVALVASASVATMLSAQEGEWGGWGGWGRRFWTVLWPGIPIGGAVWALMGVGFPFWLAAGVVVTAAAAGVATLLTAQETRAAANGCGDLGAIPAGLRRVKRFLRGQA